MNSNICRFIPVNPTNDHIHILNFVLETDAANMEKVKMLSSYRLHYVCSGSGVLCCGGMSWSVKQGDIFFLLPAVPFSFFRILKLSLLATVKQSSYRVEDACEKIEEELGVVLQEGVPLGPPVMAKTVAACAETDKIQHKQQSSQARKRLEGQLFCTILFIVLRLLLIWQIYKVSKKYRKKSCILRSFFYICNE